MMLGFSPKLPVSDEERLWVDEGFVRLEAMLGRERLLEAKVVLPDDKYFPDAFERNQSSVEKLLHRICEYMQIDQTLVKLEMFSDEADELRENSLWSIGTNRPAGIYFGRESVRDEDGAAVIALKSSVLKDPMVLVATLAHELGHLILLGGGHLDDSVPDHEPMTDLLTIFLGLGIFTANSAARFKHHDHGGGWHSWSMRRLGYLSQGIYGYALAKFAFERGGSKPEWIRHLPTNVRVYFKRSRAWLAKKARPVAKPVT
jgi:hypothetical protein